MKVSPGNLTAMQFGAENRKLPSLANIGPAGAGTCLDTPSDQC